MVKMRGLNHINLNVTDVRRSLAFYEQAFGMKVKFWDHGDRMVFLNTPGASDTLTLCQAGDGDPIGGGGVSHFGFLIAKRGKLDEAVEQVTRAGGKLLSRGEHAPGVPYAYLADPDGYVIELGNG
jgi:catechol 2,3-dioxygenase-like lactoylglutathione lyase family enzyme